MSRVQAPNAFPLSWPVSWPRFNGSRPRGKFKTSLGGALDRLEDELRRLRATNIVISSNLRPRNDGRPYADQALRVQDPGIAVYFTLNGKPTVLACDRWCYVEHNIAAIALHVEALRGIDRWGVGSIEQAFAGYAALPAHATPSDWRAVLGVGADASLALVRTAYHSLARRKHPDLGGSHEEMSKLTAAMEAAERELSGKVAV